MQDASGNHRSPTTLVDRDLELITKLRRFDLARELFQEGHHYTVTRYTEVSAPSECYICNASHRPQARVTVRNDTLKESFVCGLDCMEKYFDLRRGDLDRTSLPLKQLADTWEKFRRAVDADFFGFVGVGTKEAVEDMYGAFGKVPFLAGARGLLGTLLGDLRSVQEGLYTVEIGALRNLLGVFYESLHRPARLTERVGAFSDHPLLSPAEQQVVARVLLSVQQLIWSEFVTASQMIGNVAGKPLPVRLREVPVTKYPDRVAYLAAVEVNARAKRDVIDQRHPFLPVYAFQPTLTKAINQLVNKGGGLATFAFEGNKLETLERLQLSPTMKATLERTGVRYLEAFGGTPYEEVTTRSEKTTVRSMLRTGQLEEDEEKRRAPAKPRTGYFRGFVLYLPDPYRRTYAVWAQHGGAEVGRKLMEDLTSSL